MSDKLKPSELIKKYGWIQGQYRKYSKRTDECVNMQEYVDSLCGLCLRGACDMADVHLEEPYQATGQLVRSLSSAGRLLKEQIKKQFGVEVTFSTFNDHHTTSKEDVIDALEAVGL